MIVTSEEGSFREGNKLDWGLAPSIRDTSLGDTCELCGSEKGMQVEVEGLLAPHRPTLLSVQFLSCSGLV